MDIVTGTPLQVQKLHRLKNGNSATKSNTKSLGDSIKRHIFQKNLMSKTPKPAVPSFHTTPSNAFATPSTIAPSGSTSAATFDVSLSLHQLLHKTLKRRIQKMRRPTVGQYLVNTEQISSGSIQSLENKWKLLSI